MVELVKSNVFSNQLKDNKNNSLSFTDLQDYVEGKPEVEMDALEKVKIFISYCRKDKVYADSISEYLKQNSRINLYMDRKVIKNWNSIKEYMDSISNMDYIILLISESYLKSENCMYEALEVMNDSEYRNKIFPVVIDSEIYDKCNWFKYVRYWEDKYRELEKESCEIEQQNLGLLPQISRRYRNIAANMLEFLNEVSDMNNPQINDVAVAIEEKLIEMGVL